MTDASSFSGFSRRSLLAGIAATPALTASIAPAAAQTAASMNAAEKAKSALKDAKGTKLVILGTAAGPVPGRPRKMTSHVMLSNGAAYVLDCGLGVTDRYAETGIAFSALRIDLHHPPPCRSQHRIRPAAVVGWVQGMPLTVRPMARHRSNR